MELSHHLGPQFGTPGAKNLELGNPPRASKFLPPGAWRQAKPEFSTAQSSAQTRVQFSTELSPAQSSAQPRAQNSPELSPVQSSAHPRAQPRTELNSRQSSAQDRAQPFGCLPCSRSHNDYHRIACRASRPKKFVGRYSSQNVGVRRCSS